MASYSDHITLDQFAPWLREKMLALENYNFDRLLGGIGLILESSTKKNFDHSASPDGSPWASLKRPRTRNKAAMLAGFAGASPGLPLRDTGLLMASLTSKGQQHFEEKTPRSIEWGTAVDYAVFHQKGAPRANIPARPFVGINDEVAKDIEEFLADEITGPHGPV